MDETVKSLALANQHVLEVRHEEGGDLLRILTPDGGAAISITITREGIKLDLAGGDLALHTRGSLTLDAEHVALRGRKGVSIESDGDVAFHAEGDIHSEARIQNIRATLGNVNIKANDDVTVHGERVKLNT